jgi:hypothetical protein
VFLAAVVGDCLLDEIVEDRLGLVADAQALVDGEDDVQVIGLLEPREAAQGQDEQAHHGRAGDERRDALPARKVGQAAEEVPAEDRQDQQGEQERGVRQFKRHKTDPLPRICADKRG